MVTIGNRPLVLALLDPIPIKTRINRRQAAELVEDFLRGVEVEPVQLQSLGEFANDPPIRSSFSLSGYGRPHSLHTPFGVCEHPIRLRPRRGGEHDIGEFGRFCQKNVDDHEMVQGLQGVLAVCAIGVRHDGVFAIDQHRVDPISALF